MEIVTYQYKNYLWIQIPEELDQHVADIIRNKCEIILMDCRFKHVVFDFTKTRFMDSAGVRMIIGRYRDRSMSGGSVYAAGVCPDVEKLFYVSGLHKIIKVYSSVEDVFNGQK